MLKTQHTQPSNPRNNQAAASPPGAVLWTALATESRRRPAHADPAQGKPRKPEGLQHSPAQLSVPRTAGTRVCQRHDQLSSCISPPSPKPPAKHPLSLGPRVPSPPHGSPLLGPTGPRTDRERNPCDTAKPSSQESIKTGIWRGNVTPGYYTI